MAEIKQDLLGLQYSASFEISGLEEADINLNLSPAPISLATVYGRVTDGTDPIAEATVKLFDDKGVPFKHTLTDNKGEYSLSDIPAGTYSVAAVKKGFRLSPAAGVTLSAQTTTEINLVCTADATLTLGAIAGIVRMTQGQQVRPVAGAKITLINSNQVVVASTYSVDDGEFTFYDVSDGVYTILATAEGYLPAEPMTATIVSGSIVNLIMTMVVDTRTYNGTVSGVIRDQNGNAVAGCFVGLFELVDGEEVLIATTKTNTTGKYLFGGVSGGRYIVKAKKNQDS